MPRSGWEAKRAGNTYSGNNIFGRPRAAIPDTPASYDAGNQRALSVGL